MKAVNGKNGRGIPKYYRISRDIVAGIQGGRLQTGERVPSENEIIKAYGVSNTTARKALAEIEAGGWVRRIKGKGTYVRSNSVGRSIDRILSFTRNMVQEGRTPSTKVVGVAIRRSSHSVVVQGRQYVLAGPVCELKRVRFADGVAMMTDTRYISVELCPGIEQRPLAGSLYEIYERHYGIHLERISQMLNSIMLDAEHMRVFGVEAPTSAFCVEGVTFCGKELIVEMEESIYRGDRYRFLVEAT